MATVNLIASQTLSRLNGLNKSVLIGKAYPLGNSGSGNPNLKMLKPTSKTETKHQNQTSSSCSSQSLILSSKTDDKKSSDSTKPEKKETAKNLFSGEFKLGGLRSRYNLDVPQNDKSEQIGKQDMGGK